MNKTAAAADDHPVSQSYLLFASIALLITTVQIAFSYLFHCLDGGGWNCLLLLPGTSHERRALQIVPSCRWKQCNHMPFSSSSSSSLFYNYLLLLLLFLLLLLLFPPTISCVCIVFCAICFVCLRVCVSFAGVDVEGGHPVT
jgi:hypothetical protein